MQNIKTVLSILLFGFLLLLIYLVSDILVPFIAGIIIAYFLDPITKKIEHYGLKREWAAGLIIGFATFVIIAMLVLLIPLLFEQIQQFILEIPEYEKYVLAKINIFLAKIDVKLSDKITEQLANISSSFFDHILVLIRKIFYSSMAAFNVLGLLFLTPIIVFYLLRDWSNFVTTSHKLMPIRAKNIIIDQLNQIDLVLSAYIRGQLTVCFILVSFYVMSLSLIGLNYALLVGVIAGVLAIIPYLGFIIGGLICSLVALFQFHEMQHVYMAIGIFVFGHLVESNIITPNIIGEKIGLHPVWLIFVLLSGGALFGFWGMFFAIPVGAIIGVIVRNLCKFYLDSRLYNANE